MKLSRAMSFLLIYLMLLLAVFLLQRKMLYLPARFSQDQQDNILTQTNLQAWPNSNELRGLMSTNTRAQPKGTLLVFHGNAGAAIHRSYFIDAMQNLGYRVIIAEYPGYGFREGSPSESNFSRDGIETAKMVLREFQEPLFLCGESLGNGVVASIVAANEVPVEGLLLITPFDAMSKVAQHHYWFFLARWLLLDKYNNVAKLRNFQGNIAVVMAEQDEVIPNQRTLALYQALSENKRLWRFNTDHNNLPMQPWQSWWQETMQFIDDRQTLE